jgi:hypothetical protein
MCGRALCGTDELFRGRSGSVDLKADSGRPALRSGGYPMSELDKRGLVGYGFPLLGSRVRAGEHRSAAGRVHVIGNPRC